MSYELVVRGGVVVSPTSTARLDIGIIGGRVAALGAHLDDGDTEIDARGLVVMPGLVDVHVHLREPGMTEKEGFLFGTRAAAAGGVTTVVDMPNTLPPVATADIFAAKLDIVGSKSYVDFGLYGMLGQDNLAEIAPMAELGALGLKLFMGQTTGDNPCPDDAAIYQGLAAAEQPGWWWACTPKTTRCCGCWPRSSGSRDAPTRSPISNRGPPSSRRKPSPVSSPWPGPPGPACISIICRPTPGSIWSMPPSSGVKMSPAKSLSPISCSTSGPTGSTET